MAPVEMEEPLRTGVWLVLLVAVWSRPDIEEIDRAVRLARRVSRAMVGIRPFDSPHELGRWLPEAPKTSGSPIWIRLVDGRIEHVRIGIASPTLSNLADPTCVFPGEGEWI
jgi:hypothetical protein